MGSWIDKPFVGYVMGVLMAAIILNHTCGGVVDDCTPVLVLTMK
jgi:hypothetical protein